MKTNNTFEYASWANSIQPSIMQKMLERSTNPDMISFALGLPDPDLFPVAEYKTSLNNVANSTTKAFQYAPPIQSLKKHIVKLMESRQIQCNESQVFITGGAQQAISLLSRLLLEQRGTLTTGSITYPGFLQIVTPFSPKIIGIPITPYDGLCIESLEQVFSDRINKPAFFYIVPDGHNPLGITLTNKQKRQIAELSSKYKIPIIEDDCYGFLNYETPSKPIRAYENEWVFYVGSFSKILSPSFRTGWIIAPEEIIAKLAFIKEAIDLNTTSFGNRVVDDLLSRDILLPHLENLKNNYKARRDVMLKAIKKYFPTSIKISEPDSGFFVWVELANNLNTTNLLDIALDNNIAFLPSEEFACNKKQKKYNGMRLNFSHCKPSEIEFGIERLGRLISEISTNPRADISIRENHVKV